MKNDDLEMDVIAETDNFMVWRNEEDEDFIYHIEMGGITLHLPSEDWAEFVVLIKSVA